MHLATSPANHPKLVTKQAQLWGPPAILAVSTTPLSLVSLWQGPAFTACPWERLTHQVFTGAAQLTSAYHFVFSQDTVCLDLVETGMSELKDHWREIDRGSAAGRLLWGLYGGDPTGRAAGNSYSASNRARDACKPRKPAVEQGNSTQLKQSFPTVTSQAYASSKSFQLAQLEYSQILAAGAALY